MDLSRTLDKIFLTLPNYCLGQCISDFYQNYEFIQFCTSSVEAIFICKAFSESLLPIPPPPLQPHWAPCGVGGGAGGVGKAGGGPAGVGVWYSLPNSLLPSGRGEDAHLNRWLWCHRASNSAWAVIPVDILKQKEHLIVTEQSS